MLTCSFCTRVLQPGTRVCPTCGVEVGSAPVPPVAPARSESAPVPAAVTAPGAAPVSVPLERPTPPVAPLPSHPTEIPGLPTITVFGATNPLLVQPAPEQSEAEQPDTGRPETEPPEPEPAFTASSPEPSRASRRAVVTTATLAIVLFVIGVVGWSYLAGRVEGDTAAVVALPVPGTDLVVDKPEGWASRDLVNASPVIGGLLDGGGADAPRGELFAKGGTSMFVVTQPNSLGLTEFPEVPTDLGDLRVTAQAPVALAVGAGREIDAAGSGPIDGQRVRATFVPVGPNVVVIGALGGTDVTPEEDAAYRALVASLRPAPPPS